MADLHVHTLVVRDHRVSCCDPVIVANGMGHDAIALDNLAKQVAGTASAVAVREASTIEGD